MTARRKILLSAGVTAGVLLLAGFGAHWVLRWQAHETRTQLEAAGEVFSVGQLVPTNHPDHRAALLLSACTSLPQRELLREVIPGMKTRAEGYATVCAGEPVPLRYNDGTNFTWHELEKELQNIRGRLSPALLLLNEKPIPAFKHEYHGVEYSLWQYSGGMRLLGQYLGAEVLVALHSQGWSHAVGTNLNTLLSLAGSGAEQLEVQTQLQRAHFTRIASWSTWELLQHPDISVPLLRNLQQRWQTLSFVPELQQTLRMERARTLDTVDSWRKQGVGPAYMSSYSWLPVLNSKPDSLEDLFSQLGHSVARGINDCLWRWYFSYTDERKGLLAFQQLLQAMRTAHEDGTWIPQRNRVSAAIGREEVGSALLGEDIMPLRDQVSREQAAWKVAVQAEAAREIVFAAIAIHRFQLIESRLPNTLDELVPAYLHRMPRDLVAGGPLKYRALNQDQYKLYSLGPDGQDNGGDSSYGEPKQFGDWLQGRDWVWPMPWRKSP